MVRRVAYPACHAVDFRNVMRVDSVLINAQSAYQQPLDSHDSLQTLSTVHIRSAKCSDRNRQALD